MKNDTDAVPPGGKYMREIQRNRAERPLRDRIGSIDSAIGDDLAENPSERNNRQVRSEKRRYLQDLR